VRDVAGRMKTLPGDWVLATIDNSLYFNWKTVDNAHVSRSDVMHVALMYCWPPRNCMLRASTPARS
jgi:hypothetical protein